MNKFFALFALVFASCLCPAQNDGPFSSPFYKQLRDSALWGSPLKPAQVVKQRIKEVKILRKKWNCQTYRSDIKLPAETYTCVYNAATEIFMYDSLGFPVSVTLKVDSSTDYVYEYKFVNTYSEKRQLIKVELQWVNKNPLSGDGYEITYNEENQIQLVIQHYPGIKYPYKSEFKYIKSDTGYIEVIKEFTPLINAHVGGTSMRDTFTVHQSQRQFDSKNRLVPYYSKSFYLDKMGQDSGLNYRENKKIWRKAHRVEWKHGAVGTILTFHYNRSKIGLPKNRRTLERAREIKDGTIVNWSYRYRRNKGIIVRCSVSDLTTGLPINSKESYSWPKRESKWRYRLVRFKWVRFPPKKFRYKFPPQPNITEYIYSR